MVGGENSYIHFGYEDVFASGAIANKTFGENVTIRSVDLKNNFKRIFRLGSRSAVGSFPNKFEGALSLEFDLSDPWFMKGVLGDVTTSGSNPYYHTFTEANKPPSLTIENGISGYVRKYLGAIIGDCRITTAVGDEPARVSLTMMYTNELRTSSSITQYQSSGGVYPFSYGSFEYPTNSVVAQTESVELTITNNAAIKHSLGNRIGSRYDMRQRTYDVTTTHAFDNPTDYLEKAYGKATGPTSGHISGQANMLIKLTNGASSTAIRTWTFNFGHAVIDRHSMGTQSVEQEQMETIDIIPETVVIQCVNNISAMP
jgi:hypothetical protein